MQLRTICIPFIVPFLCAAFSNAALCQSGEEAEIFRLVNIERARSRLTPLEWDDKLARLARSYSRKMAREGFFGHYDANGNSVAERSRDTGVGYWHKIGENLFMTTAHPQFTFTSVRGWMRSAAHRRNIQDRTWTSTGVGIARSRDNEIFITQVFIRR